MRLKRQIIARTLLAVVVAAGMSGTATAQPSDQSNNTTPNPPMLRITPFIALGDDFAAGAGGAFTYSWTRKLSLEAEASLGRDAARSSLSALYSLPRLGRFAPYVAGGGGIQRDETDNALVFLNPTSVTYMTTKKTEFAVNIGAGVTIPVTDRLGYRADFRWYNPKKEWPESWRAYSGVTLGWWAPRSEP